MERFGNNHLICALSSFVQTHNMTTSKFLVVAVGVLTDEDMMQPVCFALSDSKGTDVIRAVFEHLRNRAPGT
jgi:hypothetical protein